MNSLAIVLRVYVLREHLQLHNDCSWSLAMLKLLEKKNVK